jgi:putative flippase GtrA
MSGLAINSSLLKRWIIFNSVGAIGILVQLGVLALLISKLHLNYLLATGIAVEAAVLNNFFWHENWTWADRAKHSSIEFWRRFFYFHIANGILSIAGNIVLMRFFIEIIKCSYIQANVAAIAACSIFNFLAGDLFVYRRKPAKLCRRRHV